MIFRLKNHQVPIVTFACGCCCRRLFGSERRTSLPLEGKDEKKKQSFLARGFRNFQYLVRLVLLLNPRVIAKGNGGKISDIGQLKMGKRCLGGLSTLLWIYLVCRRWQLSDSLNGEGAFSSTRSMAYSA